MNTPIKVSIVEDDDGIRGSLAIVLDGSGGFRCISSFSSAEKAVRELPLKWPDVVLMDINLKKMSGIKCVVKLKAIRPELLILMLPARRQW